MSINQRTVLVIPGRGKNSPDGMGVLREKVQAWLTHFSCRVDYTTLGPTLPANVSLAWDGLRLFC